MHCPEDQVPTYRQARNVFAIRTRTHWHTELAGACQVYAETGVNNRANVRTVRQTFKICGPTVTDNAASDMRN
jgi:hypothetical protein